MSRHEESRSALSAAVQIVTEENVSGTAYLGERRLRAMKTKLRHPAAPSALIAADPRLVVRTGVVEPEAWPPLTQQWQRLGSLQVPWPRDPAEPTT